MSTVTPPADDTVKNHESITVPDIMGYVTGTGWTVTAMRAASQILSLTVAVAALRANVKGARTSVAVSIAAVAATAAYNHHHKTPVIKEAFLHEFGITLEGARLKFTDFAKARKDGGLPVVASADGVQGIYMIHEKDDRITVTNPAGVKLQRISRR